MYGYDVHKSLYLNYNICGPWVRGSGPGAGPLWPYKNILVFFYTPINIYEQEVHVSHRSPEQQ